MNQKILQAAPETGALAPLVTVKPRGWVALVFWGLRIYIAVMLVLVVIGFSRGIR